MSFTGGDRFYDNMADMIGFRINPWLKICWLVFSPVFCLVSFIHELVCVSKWHCMCSLSVSMSINHFPRLFVQLFVAHL